MNDFGFVVKKKRENNQIEQSGSAILSKWMDDFNPSGCVNYQDWKKN